MLTFTLDTNCIIAVDDSRSESHAVLELASAHRKGLASVAVVAISASERQREGGHFENFEEFKERLSRLGLGDLDLLLPMFYWDVTFWDNALWTDEAMIGQERQIHEILFPNILFSWADYCDSLGLNQETTLSSDWKWRNAKCDVQAFWSHSYRKRNVFVTSDKNFHAETKKVPLETLAGCRVLDPYEAANLLRQVPKI